MLVKDLIVELQKLDQELPVYSNDWNRRHDYVPVTKVVIAEDIGIGLPERVLIVSL